MKRHSVIGHVPGRVGGAATNSLRAWEKIWKLVLGRLTEWPLTPKRLNSCFCTVRSNM